MTNLPTYQAKTHFLLIFTLRIEKLKDIMETVNTDLIHKYIDKYTRDSTLCKQIGTYFLLTFGCTL